MHTYTTSSTHHLPVVGCISSTSYGIDTPLHLVSYIYTYISSIHHPTDGWWCGIPTIHTPTSRILGTMLYTTYRWLGVGLPTTLDTYIPAAEEVISYPYP